MIIKNNNFTSDAGITLTELLIASIIVGIVMLGAVSIDYAVRRSQTNIIDASRIAMNLQAAMLQMTNDAMLTTGDASDQGIRFDDSGTGATDIQNICFRYDADNNPNSYTNDQWFCYSQGGRGQNNEIFRCTSLSDTSVGLTNPLTTNEACTDTATRKGTSLFVANQKGFFVVDNDVGGGIAYIELNLETCADPSAAENFITNPCYKLSSRVNPPALSR